ncbi:MAG TPA: hypothetical protein DCG57_07070 [Candidatus Riflebacteria bacterium]|jgi:hypothetical protein|nr:hypothetical protein [Candidatus Riflebacteria bacterium]
MEYYKYRYGLFPADLHFCGKCFVCEKYTRQLFFKDAGYKKQSEPGAPTYGEIPRDNPFAPPPLECVFPGDFSYWNIQKEGENRIVCLAVCEDCASKHKEFFLPADFEGIEDQYQQFCQDFQNSFLTYRNADGFAEKLKNRPNFYDPESWVVDLCSETEKNKSRKACAEAIRKELSDQVASIKTTEDKQSFLEKFNLKTVVYTGFYAGEPVAKAKKLFDNICKIYHASNAISPECQTMINNFSIICSDLVHEKSPWLNEADAKIKKLKEELHQHELEKKRLFKLVSIPVVIPGLIINAAGLPAPGFHGLQLVDCMIARDSDIAKRLTALREKFPLLKAEPDEHRRCW